MRADQFYISAGALCVRAEMASEQEVYAREPGIVLYLLMRRGSRSFYWFTWRARACNYFLLHISPGRLQ